MGPWAAEFAAQYQTSTDKTVRKVLAASVITTADSDAAGATFVACMAARNATVKVDGRGGGFSIPNTNGNTQDEKVIDPALQSCQPPFEAIAGLYGRMLRNPQHLNEATIVVKCLIKHGIVAKSYTPKRYEQEMRENTFTFSTRKPAAVACFKNPLELPGVN
ncbi:hypothetical protein ACIRCZ_18795 [Leifsonia sp. NPDC102414]|uniref:hypothetical protein n=1 Tax=Leifsonia sp. NPDC102414 TaxID=3364124 RepID=UPI0038294243